MLLLKENFHGRLPYLMNEYSYQHHETNTVTAIKLLSRQIQIV